MNIYITLPCDEYDKFTEYGNPHGMFYDISSRQMINLDQKIRITRIAHDIVFNGAKTDTPFDEFVRENFIDSDHYDNVRNDEGDEIAFIQFMNDMCFCYSHMYDMTSGDSEDYELIGDDGIKYVTICRFLDDFSIDIPIINNIIYE